MAETLFSRELAGVWADWIQLEPWDLFVNQTFKDHVHPERADKLHRVFIRRVNELLYGRRFREKNLGIYHVRALELQRRGVIHYHSLFRVPVGPVPWRQSIEAIWQDLDVVNGFCRVYPVTDRLGVARYVSKYVVKGGEIDVYCPRPLGQEDVGVGRQLLIRGFRRS